MIKQTTIAILAAGLLAGAGSLHAQLGNAALARQKVEEGQRFYHRNDMGNAITAYDACIERFQGDPDPEAKYWVLKAFLHKTESLLVLKKHGEAVAAADRAIRHYQNDARLAFTALMNLSTLKVYALASLGKLDEAVAVFDTCIARCEEEASQENRDYALMKAAEKTRLLEKLGRHQEIVAGCDALLARYANADPAFHRDGFYALMFAKGAALEKLNRRDEAARAWDALVTRYDKSKPNGPCIKEFPAQALVSKGSLLLKAGRTGEASRAFDTCLARFKEETCPHARIYIAQAFNQKALLLCEVGQLDEAVALSRECVRRYQDEREPETLEEMVKAHVFQAELLLKMQKPREAISVCEKGVERFATDEYPRLLCQSFTLALIKCTALMRMGKWEEAAAAADFYLSHDKRVSDSSCVNSKSSRAYYYKGVALEHLGRIGEARAAYQNAIAFYKLCDEPELLEVVDEINLRIKRLDEKDAKSEPEAAAEEKNFKW